MIEISKEKIEFWLNCNLEDPSEDEANGFYHGVGCLQSRIVFELEKELRTMERFEKSWKEKENLGYRYGDSELENVKLGWRMLIESILNDMK